MEYKEGMVLDSCGVAGDKPNKTFTHIYCMTLFMLSSPMEIIPVLCVYVHYILALYTFVAIALRMTFKMMAKKWFHCVCGLMKQ